MMWFFVQNVEKEIKRLDAKDLTPEEMEVIRELFQNSLIYNAALKEIQTKIDILREDFRRSNAYNPIEHIKMRIKQPVSILKKVYIRDIPLNVESIQENLNDIAGIRIVCTFKKDIYKIAEIIGKSENIDVIEVKDYIAQPKESGYQSYHMIVKIPVFLIDGKHFCKVEIQLRTMAMDFWASLEHKIKYKYDWNVPQEIKNELIECSKIVDNLDDRMENLHMKVHNPKEEQIELNL